jgi:catechol 2,3-dioxygenase-like lactoylglutathione lyase family enzyme
MVRATIRVNRDAFRKHLPVVSEQRRLLLESRTMSKPMFALYVLVSLLVAVGRTQQQPSTAPGVVKGEAVTPAHERGRIIGVGGIFFKSVNQQQTREWYGRHLGIADTGHGAMLPWREHESPNNEHVTVWTVFPGNTTYFEPGQSFMVNYIVDDLDTLLDRLQKEGVRIDPKRQAADYGRFAWIYDSDGNKIELWQPLTPPKK